MATMHDLPAHSERLVPTLEFRNRRRHREEARVREAVPGLQTDRIAPLCRVLRGYRALGVNRPSTSPLAAYRAEVEREVLELEAAAERRSRRDQRSGPTIRLALLFMKGFGRMSSLDFAELPMEERSELIALLALEYRWCLAAAGTTAHAFRLAIGRTGAR